MPIPTARAAGRKRPPLDPFAPPISLLERERTPEGAAAGCLTLFLVGAECPFGCLFCDLWRGTLEGATPAGAIPRQIELALAARHDELAGIETIKLYNAASFFDERAVPEADDAAIAALVAPFGRVVVECHPRLVGERTLAFASRLSGRLEVAMGLETAHPGALSALRKGMTVDDYYRAAELLSRHDIDHRAFVLVGTPFVPATERADWTRRSIAHAVERGARVVSLLPLRRGGDGLEPLFADGALAPPRLIEVEEALEPWVEGRGTVVQVDLWDLERLGSCARCAPARRERLVRLSLAGRAEPRLECAVCGALS
jgi:radical SAM enzyme (TIGR01210 family)